MRVLSYGLKQLSVAEQVRRYSGVKVQSPFYALKINQSKNFHGAWADKQIFILVSGIPPKPLCTALRYNPELIPSLVTDGGTAHTM
jgi:hypothetical protein